MLPYIVVFSIIFSLLFLDILLKKDTKLFMYGTFMLSFILAGFRYGIGTDYFSYESIFSYMTGFDGIWIDPGYGLLNIGIKNLGLSFQSVILVSSFICIYFIFLTIKKHSLDIRLSILLYVFMGFYFASFNIIRQYIAIGMLFYSYHYLIKGTYSRFLIINLLAISFHLSAIIFPPMLILAQKRLSRVVIASIWIFSALCTLFDVQMLINSIMPYFPERLEVYLGTDFFARNELFKLKLIIPNIMAIIFIWKWSNINKNRSYIYMNMFMFSIIGFNIFHGVPIMMRMLSYLEIFGILAIPRFVSLFKESDQKYVSLLIVLYYLALTTATVLLMGQYGVVPYQYRISL